MSLIGIGRNVSRSLSNPAIAGEVIGFTPSSSRMCSSELAFNSASISSTLWAKEFAAPPSDTQAAIVNNRRTRQKDQPSARQSREKQLPLVVLWFMIVLP